MLGHAAAAIATGMASTVLVCTGENRATGLTRDAAVSALASAAVDNIPFTATMLPIVAFLNTTIPGAENGVLWWALALGACFGGNGTMIGASAKVDWVGLAENGGVTMSVVVFM